MISTEHFASLYICSYPVQLFLIDQPQTTFPLIGLNDKMSSFEDIIKESCRNRDIPGAILVGGDGSGMSFLKLAKMVGCSIIYVNSSITNPKYSLKFRLLSIFLDSWFV